jgi:pimeloyl-ACP methyl ester carboxylesterase
LLARLRHLADEAQLRSRRLRRRTVGGLARIREEGVWLTLPDGYRVFAHVHSPAGNDPLPGVLLIPGLAGAGTSFDRLSALISADEVAALGCVCVHFDPPGLGRSWGEYDYGGPACRAATLATLEFLARAPRVRGSLGVVAISLGVASGVHVVAEHGRRLGVDWLLDWEGPCDRQVITSFGTIMKPALGHGLDDDEYWMPREAVRHVGRLGCRYLREQAGTDHAQGEYTTHAIDMVNAAVEGEVPEVRLNGQRIRRPVGPSSVAAVNWREGCRNETSKTLLGVIEGLVGSD